MRKLFCIFGLLMSMIPLPVLADLHSLLPEEGFRELPTVVTEANAHWTYPVAMALLDNEKAMQAILLWRGSCIAFDLEEYKNERNASPDNNPPPTNLKTESEIINCALRVGRFEDAVKWCKWSFTLFNFEYSRWKRDQKPFIESCDYREPMLTFLPTAISVYRAAGQPSVADSYEKMLREIEKRHWLEGPPIEDWGSDDPEKYYSRINELLHEDRLDEAEMLVQKLEKYLCNPRSANLAWSKDLVEYKLDLLWFKEKVESKRGKTEEVLKLFDLIVEQSQTIFDRSQALADAYVGYGKACIKANDFSKAESFSQKAVNMLRGSAVKGRILKKSNTYPNRSLWGSLSDAYWTLAVSQLRNNKAAEAESNMRTCLIIDEGLSGKNSNASAIAQGKSKLAEILFAVNKKAEAIQLINEAIAIEKIRHGESSKEAKAAEAVLAKNR